jgi:CBS domain-containing protein
MPTIERHMSRNLLTVSADERIVDAARKMADRGVGAVIVLEGGTLAGILTERDIMRAVAAGLTQEATVAERMTRHPETVESSESTDQAAALMIHGGFRHLPVVDAGEVKGILSIRDLMRVALEDRSPRGV